jgi:hypothetical protein
MIQEKGGMLKAIPSIAQINQTNKATDAEYVYDNVFFIV